MKLIPKKVVDPLEGVELYEWQTTLKAKVAVSTSTLASDRSHQRTVIWRWEEAGNTGKTSFAKHLKLIWPARVFYYQGNLKKSDLAHGLVSHHEQHGDWPEVILVDIARSGGCDLDILEAVKNGILHSGKYEGALVLMNPPHLVIFANHPPVETRLSLDRWDIQKIPLRIGQKRPMASVFEPRSRRKMSEGEEGDY